MKQYVREIRLQQWCGIIEAANNSNLPRTQWLAENGITKDAFYYWQKKVRKYYAEKNGLLPAVSSGSNNCQMVELPVVHAQNNNGVNETAAVVRAGNISVEISSAENSPVLLLPQAAHRRLSRCGSVTRRL